VLIAVDFCERMIAFGELRRKRRGGREEFRYCPGVWLKGLRKAMKYFRFKMHSGPDFNLVLLKYN
jgi:hypothetical protein